MRDLWLLFAGDVGYAGPLTFYTPVSLWKKLQFMFQQHNVLHKQLTHV